MKAIALLIFLCLSTVLNAQTGFSFHEKPDKKKIEVLYDQKLLTAYCYFDSTEKPILFPIKTLGGVTITRGYPIVPRPGERADDLHQAGLWFTYQNVNGIDFWNSSAAVADDRKAQTGSIRHKAIISSKVDKDNAVLTTSSQWVDYQGNALLDEVTEFVFSQKKGDFIIDRTSTLTAATQMIFIDTKDGLLGLRVARELEMPSKKETKFVDANGAVTAGVKASSIGVTGMFVNKEGIKGDSTWGKRSQWTALNGKKSGKNITIAIIDHPQNIGSPTYWHVRDYGLFAANPLGQKIFSKGKESLSLTLVKGQAVSFKFRIVLHSGTKVLSPLEIDALMKDFTGR